MKKKPVIVILGPTASGKSEWAVKLAQKFSGEIISADSRQIYKDVSINSGAVPLDDRRTYRGIPHYLLNFLDLKKDFNVTDFQKESERLIEEIIQRKNLPVICGGSIFWIKALIKGEIFPHVKPDKKLRKKLQDLTAEELYQQLQKLDSQRARTIDKNNKPRLIRALEIIETLGKVPTVQQKNPPYNFMLIKPHYSWDDLQKRIKKNVEKRWKQGMVEEIKRLYQKGYRQSEIERLGLSFDLISKFLHREIKSETELKEKIFLAEKRFAKKQLTWLKKLSQEEKILETSDYTNAEKIIQKRLS